MIFMGMQDFEKIKGRTYSFARWATTVYPISLRFHVGFLPFTKITN